MAGKTKLQKKYEEFKSNHEDYIQKRNELLREPEEKSHEIAEDLGIYTLRKEVDLLLKKKIDTAWILYRKIWGGTVRKKSVDKFVSLADEIMTYTDFVSKDMIKIWRVARDLIWAHGQTLNGEEK